MEQTKASEWCLIQIRIGNPWSAFSEKMERTRSNECTHVCFIIDNIGKIVLESSNLIAVHCESAEHQMMQSPNECMYWAQVVQFSDWMIHQWIFVAISSSIQGFYYAIRLS